MTSRPALREAPWVLLAALAAVLARLPVVAHARSLFDSDNAIGPLMSRAIWHEPGYRPLLLDGQGYLGSLDAWLLAPLCGAYPQAAWPWVLGQTLILALVVVPLCWLLFRRFAGPLPAFAGCLAIAVGLPPQLILTGAAPMAYLSNLAFGVGLLLVAVGLAEHGPSPRRLAGLGVLLGLAWWNSPQVAVFAAAPMLAIWSGGGLLTTGIARAGRAVQAALLLGVLTLLVTVGLPFVVGAKTQTSILGVSIGHPEKYFSRGVVALVLALVFAEWRCAPDRRRWLGGAGLLGASALVGLLPLLLAKALDTREHTRPWMEFRPDLVLERLPWLAEMTTTMLAGGDADSVPPLPLAALLLVVLGGGGALVWRQRAELGALLRLRRATLPPAVIAVLPGVLLLAIMAIRGGFVSGPRHFVPLLVPFGALVAVGLEAARRGGPRARAAGWGAGVFLAVAVGVGLLALPDRIAALDDPAERAMIAAMREAGVTHGYGDYWIAYDGTMMSGGEPLIACVHDSLGNLLRFRRWKPRVDEQARAGTVGAFFDLERTWDVSRSTALLDERPPERELTGRIVGRYRFGGRYLVLLMRAE